MLERLEAARGLHENQGDVQQFAIDQAVRGLQAAGVVDPGPVPPERLLIHPLEGRVGFEELLLGGVGRGAIGLGLDSQGITLGRELRDILNTKVDVVGSKLRTAKLAIVRAGDLAPNRGGEGIRPADLLEGAHRSGLRTLPVEAAFLYAIQRGLSIAPGDAVWIGTGGIHHAKSGHFWELGVGRSKKTENLWIRHHDARTAIPQWNPDDKIAFELLQRDNS